MDQTGNNAGASDLWWAVENLDAENVRRLLEDGGDANEQDGPPVSSLLHLAINGEAAEIAYEGDPGIVVTQLLVEQGADLHFVDASGRTPIEFARRGNHLAAVRYLEQKVAEADRS